MKIVFCDECGELVDANKGANNDVRYAHTPPVEIHVSSYAINAAGDRVEVNAGDSLWFEKTFYLCAACNERWHPTVKPSMAKPQLNGIKSIPNIG
jgi:DNA-directed RNA polymerase subunit M/transcription elongation factor TFIIS